MKVAIMSMLIVCVLIVGCSRSSPGPATTQPTPEAQAQAQPVRSPLSKFESDLRFVRNGLFTYIFVFSRKDGKQLNKDDANYLRKYAPQVVDWVGTDEGKRFIGGTNFNLEQGNLELLRKRFVVEDYSAR